MSVSARPPGGFRAAADRAERLRRAAERTVGNGARAVTALRGLGSVRYRGGVDPITLPAADAGATSAEVRGWALGRGDGLDAVVVFVDGRPEAVGTHDSTDPRDAPGVAPWCATARFAPGRHVVGAVAVFQDGQAFELDDQIVWWPTGGGASTNDEATEPAPTQPPDRGAPCALLAARDLPGSVTLGYLEEPVTGTTVAPGRVPVSGWAAHDPVARIEIAHGAVVEAARQMARPRADVALQIQTVHAGFCGFEHVVDLGDQPAGARVVITATAVDPTGSCTLIGVSTVTIAEASASADGIDTGPPDAPGADLERRDEPDRVAALRVRTDAVTSRHVPRADGLRILAVTHELGLGGGQLYLQELLLRLGDIAPDQECAVISPTDGPLRDELEAAGIAVHVVGTFPTDPVSYEALLQHLAFIACDFQASAVIVNTAGAMCGVDLAARIGVPALWAVHESYAPEQYLLAAYGPRGYHPSAQVRLDEAITTAAAIIFEAEATRQLYRERGDEQRLLHIEYGVPTAMIEEHVATLDRAARRRELGWADEDVVLLCVGTFEPRKAQGSLLRAFARASADHPSAVLALIGDRGDVYGRELRAYAERFGLGDRIRIEPVRPDCYDWYACADAFVLASDLESLPRSVLEAMAFGLPAVVADVFGLSQLIDDGRTGVLFEPRDLVALEGALRRVLALTADERRAMGERGRAQVRAHHDSRHYAVAYRDLLVGLTADPTARPGSFLGR